MVQHVRNLVEDFNQGAYKCYRTILRYVPRRLSVKHNSSCLDLATTYLPRLGRPKRIPLICDDKTLNQDEDVKLAVELMTLPKNGNSPIVESIADSTKMQFKRRDGCDFFFYTTEGAKGTRQIDRIKKAISRHKKDQEQRRRKEKSNLGSRPLTTMEEDEIMRNARLR